MAKILNLFLLLSGLCFPSSHALQSQFVLFQTPKTWSEAQSICREKCFDLATINDMREMETVLEVVNGKYNYAVWIGLTQDTTKSWHWSLADQDFYKEGERDYLKWSSQTIYSCGSYKDGTLRVSDCRYTKYSICFDATQQGLSQYVITPQASDWMTARDYCRTHYKDLASLRNDAEYNMVQEVANGLEVWVGLFKDLWVWSDQTYSSFRYWKGSKQVWIFGTKTCGALLNQESGKWDEVDCGKSYPFLCDCRKKFRDFKVKISSEDSMLDVNDPSVEESLLEQIMQTLIKKNVTDNFQLKWRKQDNGKVFKKEL